MATVKETATRQEFQTHQRADLLRLRRVFCDTERAMLSAVDKWQVARLAILKKRIVALFNRCGTKRPDAPARAPRQIRFG